MRNMIAPRKDKEHEVRKLRFSNLRALRAFVVKNPTRLLAQIDHDSAAHAAFENLIDLGI